MYQTGAGERVNIVIGWIYASLAARRHAGGLAMDAPVLANVWARLADGYASFEQCRCAAQPRHQLVLGPPHLHFAARHLMKLSGTTPDLIWLSKNTIASLVRLDMQLSVRFEVSRRQPAMQCL